jgi:hypothetical protein
MIIRKVVFAAPSVSLNVRMIPGICSEVLPIEMRVFSN